MIKRFLDVLQVAAVFIGTIVGAGLASGKEISNFFTYYGYKSFLGIALCGLLYILVYFFIIKITIKFNLKSYKQLIDLVSPDAVGQFISLVTSLFLIGGAAIIMAGSGAILNQYFGISKWIGISLMILFTIIVLLKDTNGLIEINSFIVPSLIIVLSTIFLLYIKFNSANINLMYLKGMETSKAFWPVSTILYAAFNILSSSGVLIPLAMKFNDKKTMFWGIAVGAIVLSFLCIAINLMLLLNVPNIYHYEIPLLFICKRFGRSFQFILLCIIWLEMFSTEISDIYSLGKTLENISFSRHSYNKQLKYVHNFIASLNYKKSIFIIILIALPISQIGFSKLIKLLYPSFGVISIFFIAKCIIFYFKKHNS
ncbi:transporter [Clostridium oryzae]|uniref:Transporter n=1 Tax=Clostridium oryzae TaxID=1450648 RepID=A0A1V4IUA5_9CLOT|nr:transporter [Clostridium oryzae]OPJ63027.1 hypothetical protein CLORY_13930 [Clostridium oryzae]